MTTAHLHKSSVDIPEWHSVRGADAENRCGSVMTASRERRWTPSPAGAMPSPTAFDRTASTLTINVVRDPARALAEQIRVTRPGGLVAAAVWDCGDGMQMLRGLLERRDRR